MDTSIDCSYRRVMYIVFYKAEKILYSGSFFAHVSVNSTYVKYAYEAQSVCFKAT